jgi:hypothetical protein
MELLIIWLFFAIVSMVVANNKNRNGVLWFFLGFLFGPFAFIVVLILPKTVNTSKIIQSKSSDLDDFFKDTNSYYYKIKIANKTSTWNNIKKDIFEHLECDYKLKRNDTEEMFFEVSKTTFIRVYQELIDHRLFYIVESTRCGKIEFSEDLEILVSKKTNDTNDDKEEVDSTNKLMQLSQLLENGHLYKYFSSLGVSIIK